MHRLPLRLLLLLFAMAMAGCSKPKPPPGRPYDSGQARQTLIMALDAWKQGQVRQLASAQPPIRFVDDDFADGWQLIDYRLDPTAALAPFENIAVDLELRDARGKTTTKTAAYQVGLPPNAAVLRADR